MIQAIIGRMASNSFLLKGWSVTLVSGFFALATANSEKAFVYLAYFPALAFWLLDGFFLHQERLFRELYNRVRMIEESQIDFSMNTTEVERECESWWQTTRSPTLCLFHGAVIGAIVLVMLTKIFTN